MQLRLHGVIPMCNCAVRFFVRWNKNSQAVVELQIRIFLKYDGKDANKCATRALRGDALNKPDEYQSSSGFHYVHEKTAGFFQSGWKSFLKEFVEKGFFLWVVLYVTAVSESHERFFLLLSQVLRNLYIHCNIQIAAATAVCTLDSFTFQAE